MTSGGRMSKEDKRIADMILPVAFVPGGYHAIEDPPRQNMKWPDIVTGAVYDSFDEYWQGVHGHKFREAKQESKLALTALYYAALMTMLAATAGLRT